MTETSRCDDSREASVPARARMRVPGFVSDEEVGLGDVIKRATGYFGVKPCGGCEKRAAALNRLMTFKR